MKPRSLVGPVPSSGIQQDATWLERNHTETIPLTAALCIYCNLIIVSLIAQMTQADDPVVEFLPISCRQLSVLEIPAFIRVSRVSD